MKRTIVIILISMCLMVSSLAQQPVQDIIYTEAGPPIGSPAVRFAPLHVFLDSGDQALAAFQFELKTSAGQIKIVGVEGGEHPAFGKPPYYDPAALTQDRIIIAAFDTGDDLPTGRTRIATIHLQIIGDIEPDYALDLTVAASVDGEQIPAEITFEKGE